MKSLWKSIICQKYGWEESFLNLNLVVVGWNFQNLRIISWKLIVWRKWSLLWLKLWWLIGDGGKVKFWEDIWCDVDALAILFPRLYSLWNSKYSTIDQVRYSSSNGCRKLVCSLEGLGNPKKISWFGVLIREVCSYSESRNVMNSLLLGIVVFL